MAMENDIPTIAYWGDRPLSELPREELEQALCDAHHQIADMRMALRDSSIAHVRDLAAMGRERLRYRGLTNRF